MEFDSPTADGLPSPEGCSLTGNCVVPVSCEASAGVT